MTDGEVLRARFARDGSAAGGARGEPARRPHRPRPPLRLVPWRRAGARRRHRHGRARLRARSAGARGRRRRLRPGAPRGGPQAGPGLSERQLRRGRRDAPPTGSRRVRPRRQPPHAPPRAPHRTRVRGARARHMSRRARARRRPGRASRPLAALELDRFERARDRRISTRWPTPTSGTSSRRTSSAACAPTSCSRLTTSSATSTWPPARARNASAPGRWLRAPRSRLPSAGPCYGADYGRRLTVQPTGGVSRTAGSCPASTASIASRR
jgi:hypothetical protein